jgi:acylglycerol lipase
MLFAQTNPPHEQWLDGTGGKIFTRHWRPPGGAAPRAALVICHGVNSHGGQYLRSAEAFAAAGFAVTALDLRGRGRSEGERFHVGHVDEYVADLSLAIELAKARDPSLPCFLLGHSAGGVVSVSYALDHQDRLAGLICESFAFRVFAPDLALTLLKGASHVLPDLPALKLKMRTSRAIRRGSPSCSPTRTRRMKRSRSRPSPPSSAPATGWKRSSARSRCRC